MRPKTLTIIGDSISTFEGAVPPYDKTSYPKEGRDVVEVDQCWWKIVANEMGWEIDTVQSYSGARVSLTGEDQRPLWSSCTSERRLSDLGKPDYIIVLAGTNDFGQVNPAPKEVFRAAYIKLVEEIAKRQSQAKLFCCTPTQRTNVDLGQKNTENWTQLDLAQIIRDICFEKKVSVIDLAVHPITKDDGLLVDGLHPSKKGMQWIADIVVDYLRRNI